MRPDDFPLEPSGEEMRRLVDAAMERIVAHIVSLPSQPAANVEGAVEVARSLREPMPETGTPFPELLALLFDRAIPKSFNTAGPGYVAYIPGGGLFDAAVADLIADSVNRYVGVWAAAPALVQLETNVVRWLCDVAGLPEGAGGFLTTGGSFANFSAIVTARREKLGDDFLKGTLYVSDQTHHSVQKAALLAGFPPRNVRSIPSDATYRIRVDLLREAIAKDRAEGFSPLVLVGNGGTTNTGAVDDLRALADVAAEEKLWFHVDAAYGGFFLLTERGRKTLAGIERADSITLDPHKGFFLPYGTGSLLVRDADALRRAHALHAEYLPPLPEADDFVDYSQISPELSRDFRGLRVWLPLKRHGAAAFRKALDEKLDLTAFACEGIRAIPGIEIVAEPQLSLF
ncbi:MAG TPA: aminotransferase class I/II-fold pyridoxal phosphate-dependent enzyme, partial [Thermoanaerobaculia bacterium]|nr:aminotransferase class I/II-fold pyridoxal phosphate-dependent enzyme [Thermoanaerobaculia bacterium]